MANANPNEGSMGANMSIKGTTLYRWGDSFGGKDGMRIIKAGVMDDVDVINNTKPGAELFAPERIKWVGAIDGAGQVDTVSTEPNPLCRGRVSRSFSADLW